MNTEILPISCSPGHLHTVANTRSVASPMNNLWRSSQLSRQPAPIEAPHRYGRARRGRSIELTNDMVRSCLYTEEASSRSEIAASSLRPKNISAVSEQLIDLHFLCKIKSNGAPVNQKVMAFCRAISKQKVHDPQLLIGKVMLLVDQDLPHLISLIDTRSLSNSIAAVEAAFENQLNLVVRNLKDCEEGHRLVGLQSSQGALANQLSVQLSKLVITESGVINTTVIPLLKRKFLSSSKLSFERDIQRGLDSLLQSHNLRSRLRAIEKPISEKAPGNDIIRITLGLPSDAEITHADAKRTALSALLSHLRQGASGSCFTTPLAIETLRNDPEKCLEDFQEILKDGKLTRNINGLPVSFNFLTHAGGDSLNGSMTIDRSGRLVNQYGVSYPMWESPGLQAACRAVGIENVQQKVTEVLPEIFEDAGRKRLIQIPVEELLEQIIQSNGGSSRRVENQLKIALLAYDAETLNPLQRVWENAIAGMAEAEETGRLRQAFGKSVVESLREAFPREFNQNPLFLNVIAARIMIQSEMRYDRSQRHGVRSQDDVSAFGAFVMYDKAGNRIDNAEAFQKFIAVNIKEAQKTLGLKDISKVRRLTNYVQTDEFLESVLRRYSPLNSKKSLLDQIDKLEHTPWCDKSGNSAKNVIRIYHEETEPRVTGEIVSPRNAEELMNGLQKAVSEHANATELVNIHGLHTCTLFSDQLRLVGKQAFESNVRNPGISIAHTPIHASASSKVLQYASNFHVPKKEREKFNKLSKNIGKGLTVQQYRNAVLDLILTVVPARDSEREFIARDIDTFICNEALPENERAILSKSALRFADTNWQHGVHDIHFCFIVNPGSGKLEVWEVLENGSGFQALNQSKWAKSKWELLNH